MKRAFLAYVLGNARFGHLREKPGKRWGYQVLLEGFISGGRRKEEEEGSSGFAFQAEYEPH